MISVKHLLGWHRGGQVVVNKIFQNGLDHVWGDFHGPGMRWTHEDRHKQK